MLHFKFLLAFLILFSQFSFAASSLYISANPKQSIHLEELLLRANMATIKKPYPVNTISKAYLKVCVFNTASYCSVTKRLLDEYTAKATVKLNSVSLSYSDRESASLSNQYGRSYEDNLVAQGHAHYAVSLWFKVSADLALQDNELNTQQGYVSVGWESAQLDLGYRAHWLSPFQNSSMLISTHAETMPSITLSNTEPFSVLGIQYELFVAKMSESNHIYYNGELTTGSPILTGIHFSLSPFDGFTLSANRVMQSGGRDKTVSFKDLIKAFLDPSGEDNTSAELSVDEQFGNQAATLNAKYTFNGDTPFALYMEYGGEDTSRGYNWRLGNSAMSAGVFIPNITEQFGLTVEWSDWQNAWYQHHVYRSGLTNQGNIIGHWAAEYRHHNGDVYNDAVGASQLMVKGHYQYDANNSLIVQFDHIRNYDYTQYDYVPAHKLQLDWYQIRDWAELNFHLELGKDSFDQSYFRIATGVNW